MVRIFVCCCLGLFFSQWSFAVIDAYEFEDEVQRQRYLSFIEEMRCPKCQNQNLAGSDSPIAQDLRRELYLMLEDGKSDKEITDFMVARYGDYVLYKPQVKKNTYMLWGLPLVLFALGVIIVLITVAKRRRAQMAEDDKGVSAAEDERLQRLLKAADERRSNSKDSQE